MFPNLPLATCPQLLDFSGLLVCRRRPGRLRFLAVPARAVVFKIFRRSSSPVFLPEILCHEHGFEMSREVIEFHGKGFRLRDEEVVAKE